MSRADTASLTAYQATQLLPRYRIMSAVVTKPQAPWWIFMIFVLFYTVRRFVLLNVLTEMHVCR